MEQSETQSPGSLERMVSTPIVDALCESRYEPASGLIWADDARKIEREKIFYRELLEQITHDSRKTRARRLAESGLTFWDAMQHEVEKRKRANDPISATAATKRPGSGTPGQRL